MAASVGPEAASHLMELSHPQTKALLSRKMWVTRCIYLKRHEEISTDQNEFLSGPHNRTELCFLSVALSLQLWLQFITITNSPDIDFDVLLFLVWKAHRSSLLRCSCTAFVGPFIFTAYMLFPHFIVFPWQQIVWKERKHCNVFQSNYCCCLCCFACNKRFLLVLVSQYLRQFW